MDRYESSVDRQIREAQERGDFDNLPGAGRPIPGLTGRDDADWWVKGLMEREGLKAPLPPALALRREIEQLPETLADVRDERVAQALVEALNDRILDLRRRPPERGVPLFVRTVDVDEALVRWRAAR